MIVLASGATTLLMCAHRSHARGGSPASRASRVSQLGQRKWTEDIRSQGTGYRSQESDSPVTCDLLPVTSYFARSIYRLSVGSTMISSPSVTNGGTCTTTPFSSVAGLYDADAVEPFTIGSVSAIFALIGFGNSMPNGFASWDCTRVFSPRGSHDEASP